MRQANWLNTFDWICEKGSHMHNYIYQFEKFNAVYLKNAWCLFYTILDKSVAIQWIYIQYRFNATSQLLVSTSAITWECERNYLRVRLKVE